MYSSLVQGLITTFCLFLTLKRDMASITTSLLNDYLFLITSLISPFFFSPFFNNFTLRAALQYFGFRINVNYFFTHLHTLPFLFTSKYVQYNRKNQDDVAASTPPINGRLVRFATLTFPITEIGL